MHTYKQKLIHWGQTLCICSSIVYLYFYLNIYVLHGQKTIFQYHTTSIRVTQHISSVRYLFFTYCPPSHTMFCSVLPAQHGVARCQKKLCLWHVRKAWAKNTVKKISSVVERTIVLQMLGDIMYGKCCNVDDDHVDWAFDQLDKISLSRPHVTSFMRYMNKVWPTKIPMWCVEA